jgi:hypothetical protein
MLLSRNYIFAFLLLTTVVSYAQDTSNVQKFDFKNLKPIVQVFGTANYNITDNRYGYSIGRAHLGFEYSFNNKWSAKIILDRGRPTTFNDLIVTDSMGHQLNVNWEYSEGAYYTMYLKFASLRWKVNKKLTIEGGAILQNHYITQERFWGLRYVAQTFQDLYWRIPSTDLGFIAYYTINKYFSLDAALTNGDGPRINQDDLGNIKIAGGVNIDPCDKFHTRLYYHFRQTSNNGGSSNEQMLSFFAGMRPSPKFRIGGEFNYMDNPQGMEGLTSYGYSIYSAYRVFTKAEIFVRYDRILYEIPKNMITSSFDNGNTLIGGASYSPVQGVWLSLNYQGWFPDGGDMSIKSMLALSMEYKL